MEASRWAPGRRGGGSCHRRHLPPDTAPQPALISMTGPGGHGRPRASGHQCSQCVLGNKWPHRLPVLLHAPDRSSTRAGGGLLVTIESVCQSRQVGKPRPEGTPMSQTHRQQGPRSLPRRASPSPSSAPCPGMAVRLSAPTRLAPPSAAETGGGGLWGAPLHPAPRPSARRSRVQHLPRPSLGRDPGGLGAGAASALPAGAVRSEQVHLRREGRPVPTDGPQAACCPWAPEHPPLGRRSAERGWAGRRGSSWSG